MRNSGHIHTRQGAAGRTGRIYSALAIASVLLAFGLLQAGTARASAAVGPTVKAAKRAKQAGTKVIAHRVNLRGIYWGANIGPQLTGEEAPYGLSAIPAFDHEMNKRISIDHMGWPFASCSGSTCSQFAFPYEGASEVRADGAIPLISFQTQGFGSQYDGRFSLKAIASGEWDSYFEADAQEAKAWGHPYFLRFDWEMNGNWFPWGVGAEAANTPAEYVAAWRHVHNIFTRVGATNTTWVWCPNVAFDSDGGIAGLKALYPGNAYVNWTCLDGYNTGTEPGTQGIFQSWSDIYKASYDAITQGFAKNKPMMVGEFGSTSFGGSKAAWISNALAVVPTEFPKIRALVYWDRVDTDTGVNWDLESNASSILAFRIGIKNPLYVTNHFGKLGNGPISAPTVTVTRYTTVKEPVVSAKTASQ